MLAYEHLIVTTLGSGSRGNCTFIGGKKEGVLIDCGLSTRQIMKRLEQIGHADTPIKGVLITHEHRDHIGAARILEKAIKRRHGHDVPFFMTAGTARNLPSSCRPKNIVEIYADRPFRLEHWIIEPLSIHHDTPDPVAYTIQNQATRIGVFTDFGRVTSSIHRQLSTLDIVVLEFNHDLEMLLSGDYPDRLKERVKGPYGHLSNKQAATLLETAGTDRLKHVILAHLSQENNTIDRAYLACKDALSRAGLSQTRIHVSSQVEPLKAITASVINHQQSPRADLRTHGAPNPLPRQPSLFPDF